MKPPSNSTSQPASPFTPRRTSGLATAAFISGMIGLMCALILSLSSGLNPVGAAILILSSVLAVRAGHISLSQCKRNTALDSKVLGLIGLILGYTSVAASLLVLTISAFSKTRIRQDKLVFNHARQLALAAEQYYLESSATYASYRQIVGPNTYIKTLNTVAGETYPTHFTKGVTITITGVGGARTITYAP